MNNPQINIDWDAIFMTMAFAAARASRCVSRNVGVVITQDNHVIATGANNTPADTTKCDALFPPKTDPKFNRGEHHEFSNDHEVHAEMNAMLSLLGRGGYDLRRATLYSTLKPCANCLKHIIEVGIPRVVYAEDYDLGGYGPYMNRMIFESDIQLEYKPILNEDLLVKTALDINHANEIYAQIIKNQKTRQ
ncbi:hypothetical protein HDR63_01155 [bacterium]|nr:hypothetical protein [bacterium]